MTKKQPEQELSSFQEAVKGVKPIQNDRIDLYAHPENTRPFKDQTHYDETAQLSLSDERECIAVTGEEFLFFAQSGLQLKAQKELRQGKIIIDDHLDLHGLTINEARETLLEFINFSQKQQIRCIRLVHGKGYRSNTQKPILKNKINSWLRQHPSILAFSSAQPKDGGTGALYIIIKKM
ncbi:MAG: Smr/MutS family protein [gamma proteobacterium symbiont of Bathyaustriella thionipta]|nr:Smr/MutS family protein [gamma proteobacterium symbiont of Bathyaustriella thionipta]MCU7950999.1 Smr/MutS family protein [gamma proteobacterium symbiont of Bathyaustriella thionipta]MCU7951840.1 Smr/MutS family protein [gamma proteobacterium symbiont of Bathyaustriella thionipta]MCU7957506.1 Smr/MutS family protein [gamma proteobacterium symbiont of Bathyaustriella thionipta]MCU7968206.1 Smr/MutS family protein [gamma proteobacterium symbiont of Bathyaustriella thionipta]